LAAIVLIQAEKRGLESIPTMDCRTVFEALVGTNNCERAIPRVAEHAGELLDATADCSPIVSEMCPPAENV
jgi:hypothetical protein